MLELFFYRSGFETQNGHKFFKSYKFEPIKATPDHLSAKLDNIRSELTTMEGVLEVKNEHFWSSGFNQIAGSLQVRVSRNTNEQKVLAMIVLKLFPVVPKCSVQVFKSFLSHKL